MHLYLHNSLQHLPDHLLFTGVSQVLTTDIRFVACRLHDVSRNDLVDPYEHIATESLKIRTNVVLAASPICRRRKEHRPCLPMLIFWVWLRCYIVPGGVGGVARIGQKNSKFQEISAPSEICANGKHPRTANVSFTYSKTDALDCHVYSTGAKQF